MTEEKFNELVEMVKDQGVRLRSVEDFILGRVNAFLDLSNDLKNRVEMLEEHDKEFMAMVHNTCDIKNKEIQVARKESIEISCDHADKNHKQTWTAIAFIVSTVMGLVVYFNVENTQQALDLRQHDTQIEGMYKTLDKIDGKLDKLGAHLEEHAK